MRDFINKFFNIRKQKFLMERFLKANTSYCYRGFGGLYDKA